MCGASQPQLVKHRLTDKRIIVHFHPVRFRNDGPLCPRGCSRDNSGQPQLVKHRLTDKMISVHFHAPSVWFRNDGPLCMREDVLATTSWAYTLSMVEDMESSFGVVCHCLVFWDTARGLCRFPSVPGVAEFLLLSLTNFEISNLDCSLHEGYG